jgi:hypothetical protein
MDLPLTVLEKGIFEKINRYLRYYLRIGDIIVDIECQKSEM